MMERLFTIGAYGFESDEFFDTLQDAKVDLFLDLRRRRGVRGRQSSFANSTRLQKELAARGIAYRHLIDLAPQPATRELQNQKDTSDRVAKRKRTELAGAFVDDYTHRTLEPFDWNTLAKELEAVQRPVLFCVERTPTACHRSLVAARLAATTGVPVKDLV